MSSSLLFDYIATYMYEDDTPPAERRAQALSLDRDLLRELLGSEALRELLDAEAVEQVERQLRGEPRTPDELHDQLRLRGDRRAGEFDPALAAPLLAERRALAVRIAGEERLIAAEDAGRYRDGLGAMPPGGLPDVFLEGGPDSLRQLVLRYAKGRGPFTTAEAGERFGRDARRVAARARTGGAARPRRAAAGRQRARVVRPRRPAPAAPRLARRAPPRGRAGRAGRARPLPPLLARDRPPGDPARGARPAAVARPPGRPLGERAAAPARARLPPRAARLALRERGGGVGRCRPRPRRALLPRGRRGARAGRRHAPARGRAVRAAPCRAQRTAPSSGRT